MIASAIGYAFALGLVAAINPCGLPLLAGYLAFYTGSAQAARGSRMLRSLFAGACITLGFLIVFSLLGLVVTGVQGLLTSWSAIVLIVLGALMVIIGARTLAGRPPRALLPQLPVSPGRTAAAMVGFGAAYAVGSLGCALPLFMVGVAGAFRAGFGAGAPALLAYALGMGLLVLAAGVISAALGDSRLLRRLGPVSRALSLASDLLLIVLGLYLIVSSALELAAPTVATALTNWVSTPQASVARLLESQPWLVGAGLAAIVAAAMIASGIRRARLHPVSEEER